MNSNELKYLVISDTSQKYDKINKKILKFAKIYFNIMNNYSSEIISIEKNNNYFYFGDIKLKELLENQYILIKELVRIINDILLDKINNEVLKKCEDQSSDSFDEPLLQKNNITNKKIKMLYTPDYSNNKSKGFDRNKKEIKNEIKNNIKKNIKNNYKNNKNNNLISQKLLQQKEIIPLNIIYPKTNNEYNGTLSFFNMNTNNNNTYNYKLYEKQLNKNDEYSPYKPQMKTINSFEKSNSHEIKEKIFPNLKYNNINNFSYYKINNYTIDEEINDTGNNEKQTYITSNHYLDEDYGNYPETLSFKKKQIKYRSGSCQNLFENDINNRSKLSDHKNLPIKRQNYINSSSNLFNIDDNNDFSYKKRSNTSFNFFKPNLYSENNVYNNVLEKFRKNTLYSVPYINNGKINSPSKLTKKFLNSSYKKLKNYNKKRYVKIEE